MKRLLLGGTHHGEKIEITEGNPFHRMPAKIESTASVHKPDNETRIEQVYRVEDYLVHRFNMFGHEHIVYIISDEPWPEDRLYRWLAQFL